MMTWAPCTCEHGEFRKECLHDDCGQQLGAIMQFYETHPYYAISKYGRLGPYSTPKAAREAVEKTLETGTIPTYRRTDEQI